MTIAVITAAYNAERHLANTIERVRAQTYTDWRMVIVDDGSTDRTTAIAREFAALDTRMLVIQQPNAGASNARNRAMKEAGSDCDCFALLDHDDLWEPDALEILTTALSSHAEATGAHGQARPLFDSGAPDANNVKDPWPAERWSVRGGELVLAGESDPTTFEMLAYMNCIPACATLVRREAIEEAGGFDRAAGSCDDYDLWLRVTRRAPMRFVPRVLMSHLFHASNISNDRRSMEQDEARVRRNVMAMPALTASQRAAMRDGHRLWRRSHYRLRMQWTRDCLAHGQMTPALRNLYHAGRQLAHMTFDCR